MFLPMSCGSGPGGIRFYEQVRARCFHTAKTQKRTLLCPQTGEPGGGSWIMQFGAGYIVHLLRVAKRLEKRAARH